MPLPAAGCSWLQYTGPDIRNVQKREAAGVFEAGTVGMRDESQSLGNSATHLTVSEVKSEGKAVASGRLLCPKNGLPLVAAAGSAHTGATAGHRAAVKWHCFLS